MGKMVEPSVKETAFSCPHCDALTTQHWYYAYAEEIFNEDKLPNIIEDEIFHKLDNDTSIDRELKNVLKLKFEKVISGQIFLESTKQYCNSTVANLFLCRCFNCGGVSVWKRDSLIYPPRREGPPPNRDLPEHIRADYEEARSIVGLSPRGAAALLRLCIQKLCISLGEKGRNIDDDIASLVRKGLNPMVQQSLDVVRVVGNEAVHPGVIDLKDDNATAVALFGIVNIIAEQLISIPQHIKSMYERLPENKRKAIADRDKR